MSLVLNPAEIRVLGVLIEKSLSQPAYYPMTINAVVSACNQKSNRHPVMQLTEGEVAAGLHGLQQWQLVAQAPPEPGARTNRFCHEVERRFGWNAAQRAIMAELMLRGPQTLGELRAHASRMTHLESTDYIEELLRELMQTDPPVVAELPRSSGRTVTRYAQLLGAEVQSDAAAPPAAVPPGPATAARVGAAPATLQARVENLEADIANIRASLAALRQTLREAGVLHDDESDRTSNWQV